MVYSHEVENMCVVKKGPNHGPAPIPEEGQWVKVKEVKDDEETNNTILVFKLGDKLVNYGYKF